MRPRKQNYIPNEVQDPTYMKAHFPDRIDVVPTGDGPFLSRVGGHHIHQWEGFRYIQELGAFFRSRFH